MSSEPSAKPEDDFASRLARYDDEVVAGRESASTPPAEPSPNDLGTDERRVEQAKPVLHMLETLWPRGAKKSARRPKKERRFPTDFGRFKVTRELGRGGFGVVFEAFDPMLGRNVALKMPRPEVLVSPTLADRFFAEARTAAGLKHPNIVDVYEAGEIGPTCYIVSELCKGPNLAEWLKSQRYPVAYRTAARLTAVLAEAVGYAQDEGVLHRDIKPSNVLLFPPHSDRAFVAKSDASHLGFDPRLSDFGLAKLLEEKSDGEETPGEAIVGTPEYMAPEQAAGRVELIGPATDVYSLGSVLYELLVGAPLVPKSTSAEEIQDRLPVDPTAIRNTRPDVPHDLEAICLRCLEADPAARYANAVELGEDLRRYLAGMPTKARPLTCFSRLSRLTRRRPTESLLVIVVFVFVAVAILGAWLHQQRVETVETEMEVTKQIFEEQQKSVEEEHRRVLNLEYVGDVHQAAQSYENGNVEQCLVHLAKHFPTGLEPDRRGFEWFRLWRLCHQEEAVIEGAHDTLYHVAYSPNGQNIVAACADGSLMLWNRQGKDFKTLPARHSGEVNTVTYSHDGQRILSGGDDTTIQVLDEKGTLVRKLRGHQRGVRTLAAYPNGQPWVASGAMEPTVKLWNYETGEVIRSWVVEGKDVESIFFSPDGHQLGIACSDGSLYVLMVDKSEPPRLLGIVGAGISAGAILPGGKSLIVGGKDSQLTILDMTTGKILRRWRAHVDWIHSIALSADGTWCVSAGRDHLAKIWNIADGRLLGRMTGHRGRVWGVAIQPTGSEIATCGDDKQVRLWSRERAGDNPVLTEVPSEPITLSNGPRASTVTIGCRAGEFRIVDLKKRTTLHASQFEGPVTGNETCEQGLLATSDQKGHVKIWRDHDAKLETTRELAVETPSALSWSPDGSRLIVCSLTGDMTLIDLEDRQPPKKIRAHGVGLRAKFSPGNNFIVSASYDGTAKIWDADSLAPITTIRYHERHLNGVEFDPSGTLMALPSGDSTVGVFSLSDGKLVKSLQGPADEAVAVAFSQDGRTVISACRNGTVQMWNIATMQEVYSAQTGLKSISTMTCLASNGGLIIGGTEQQTDRHVVIVWEVAVPAPAE